MQVYERRTVEVQRDMDLVRELLLRIEQDKSLDGTRWIGFTPAELGMEQRSVEEIAYHLDLLIDAGLVEGKSYGGAIPAIARLTWDGHEFLDNIKNTDVWSKTKQRVGDLANVSLKVIAAIAEAEIKKRLGLS